MLARMQRGIVLLLCLAAVIWAGLTWDSSPRMFWGGLLLLFLGHSVFLAIEFVLVYRVNRHDPTPRAGLWMLLQAWCGETLRAPRVFCWQQPFREHAYPDQLKAMSATATRRGVVLVHGFVCNRGFWNPWLVRLGASGHVYAAVSLEPVFGSIDDYVGLIDSAVQRVAAATGLPPLLVCHSMGGLAARAWLDACQADDRVFHVVTIGSPHHGTWLGRVSHTRNGREMRLDSPWLSQLAAREPLQRWQRFTCYYSNCDNIVFPASVARIEGADNRLVEGVAHVALAFDRSIMDATLALLDR